MLQEQGTRVPSWFWCLETEGEKKVLRSKHDTKGHKDNSEKKKGK